MAGGPHMTISSGGPSKSRWGASLSRLRLCLTSSRRRSGRIGPRTERHWLSSVSSRSARNLTGRWGRSRSQKRSGHGCAALPRLTNTRNTPIEVLERAFPMRVLRYRLRRGSGGAGWAPGGEGIERDLLTLEDGTVSLITERRVSQPWGLAGGAPGAVGENWLLPAATRAERLPDKCTIHLKAGDVFRMLTPGGGGWGPVLAPRSESLRSISRCSARSGFRYHPARSSPASSRKSSGRCRSSRPASARSTPASKCRQRSAGPCSRQRSKGGSSPKTRPMSRRRSCWSASAGERAAAPKPKKRRARATA
ncbi:MAG: hydantoinase B/oxoprolinase family protein [Acidimicrobiia bacterium]|nr:hydantoinase B/oxoprolinase family protein [Acidimicrobiia bacterium]